MRDFMFDRGSNQTGITDTRHTMKQEQVQGFTDQNSREPDDREFWPMNPKKTRDASKTGEGGGAAAALPIRVGGGG